MPTIIESLFSIKWSHFFPIHYSQNITFTMGRYSDVENFLIQYQNELPDGRENKQFTMYEQTLRKKIYYQKYADHFLIQDDHKTIGFFTGNVLDWSSYYFRYIYILKEYRGDQLSLHFYQHLITILQSAGVDRVEAHIAPNDHLQYQKLLSLGLVQTGMWLTDRWGALVHMTKFLTSQKKDFFDRQFCWRLNAEPKE